ncbi:MAG: transporter substrate-binding domain-containing protein [Oscillospiraceae bacterium]|nr:transporter substrate-binding domain-containing protein [Oscillospiraceae bacterium]
MKKILALLLVLVLVFGLVACGGDDDGIEINTPADLEQEGVRIGVQNGTTGHDFASANFPDAEIVIYNSNVDVIQALLSEHVDAVILDESPGASFVARNEGRIRQLDERLTHEYYGISLQLGSPYTALFNEALDQLRADGTLDRLVDYWINGYTELGRYESPAGIEHPNGTLVMGTSADFEPFEFIEAGQIVGLDPDIARAIGDILGYQIEIVDMDFDIIILSVQTGQVDFGMAGMTVNEERLQQVDFTQGYFLSGQSIIVRVR